MTVAIDTDAALTPRGWFFRGAKDALIFPAWTVAAALMGVGSLAQAAGQPLGSALLSTILIWAGPAQVIFYSGLASGMALPALAFVVGLSSMRFLPMTMALVPLVRQKGQSVWLQFLVAHYTSVTVWAESLRRLPHLPQNARIPYYFGFANACVALSTLTTGVGYYLSAALPTPLAAALLFITPVFFTVSISAGARDRSDWIAIGLGFALEPIATALVGQQFDLLAVGALGGTAAFIVSRMRGPGA